MDLGKTGPPLVSSVVYIGGYIFTLFQCFSQGSRGSIAGAKVDQSFFRSLFLNITLDFFFYFILCGKWVMSLRKAFSPKVVLGSRVW